MRRNIGLGGYYVPFDAHSRSALFPKLALDCEAAVGESGVEVIDEPNAPRRLSDACRC